MSGRGRGAGRRASDDGDDAVMPNRRPSGMASRAAPQPPGAGRQGTRAGGGDVSNSGSDFPTQIPDDPRNEAHESNERTDTKRPLAGGAAIRPGAVSVAEPPRQQTTNQTMPGAQASSGTDQRAWREVAKGRIGQASAVDDQGREDMVTLAGATTAATVTTPDDRTVDTLTTYATEDQQGYAARRQDPLPTRPGPPAMRQQPPQPMYRQQQQQQQQQQPMHRQQQQQQQQEQHVPTDFNETQAPVAHTVEEDEDLEKRLEARVLAEAEQIARNLRNALIENTVQAQDVRRAEPVVPEPEPEPDPPSPDNGGRKWLIFGVIACIVVAIGGGLGVVFALAGGDDDGDDGIIMEDISEPPSVPPTDVPTEAPSPSPSEVTSVPSSIPSMEPTRSRKFRSMLETLMPVSGDLLLDESTFQYQAFEWLVFDDPRDLDPEVTTDQTIIDRYVAALLYFATDGENWVEQYDFLSATHFCDWNDGTNAAGSLGITCNRLQVSEIRFEFNGLRGTLPEELAQYTMLDQIDLESNELQGTIPEWLGSISAIRLIILTGNFFTGTIPASFFDLQELQVLYLTRNDITGTLPPNLGNAAGLRLFSLFDTNLDGTIPESVGRLSRLEFFQIFSNSFTGRLPNSLFQLPNIQVIAFTDNILSGTLPDFANQVSLTDLFAASNFLTGTVPSSLGLLPSLETCFLRGNSFDGTLPPFSGNLGALKTLFSDDNRLTGAVHDIIRSMPTSLEEIDIGSNRLDGSIPTEIGLFSSLTFLDFFTNNLVGTLPTELGALVALETVALAINDMTGTLPTEFGNLRSVGFFEIGENFFNGTLPTEMGDMTSLTRLAVSNCDLTGTVPTSWRQLTNLDRLLLNGNFLSGNLDPIFCSASFFGSIDEFLSDCGGTTTDVICTCCSRCCDDLGGTLEVAVCEDNVR